MFETTSTFEAASCSIELFVSHMIVAGKSRHSLLVKK